MKKITQKVLSLLMCLSFILPLAVSCGNPTAPETEPETKLSENETMQVSETVKETESMKAPETKVPETKAPETKVSETKVPETKAPETKVPETKAPETKAPETKAPETKAPETKAPETKAPETKAPETKAPETKAPETKAPETKAPETKKPETKAPETVKETEPPQPLQDGAYRVVIPDGYAFVQFRTPTTGTQGAGRATIGYHGEFDRAVNGDTIILTAQELAAINFTILYNAQYEATPSYFKLSGNTIYVGEAEPETEPSEEPELPPIPVTPEVMPSGSHQLSVNGVDISEYTIVYPLSIYEEYGTRHCPLGDTDQPKQIAERLQKVIKSYTGKTLKIATSSQSAYQIKLTTDERLGHFYNDAGNYRVSTDGKTITLYGDCYGALWHSMDYLIGYINAQPEKVDLESLRLAGKHDMFIIACIGDSLTAGENSAYCYSYSSFTSRLRRIVNYSDYPADVNRAFWKDAIAINYGRGGYCMTHIYSYDDDKGHHDNYYMGEDQYADMLSAAGNIDLCVIMLGTNDGWNWRSHPDAESQYLTEGTRMIEEISSKKAGMKFIIANCPKCGNNLDGVRTAQKKLYEKMKAAGKAIYFADVYAATKDLTKEEAYDDYMLHFNNNGYAIVAEEIIRVILTIGVIGES